MRVDRGIKIHLCARLVGLTERRRVAECGGERTVKKSQINALMNRARRACSRGYSIISGRVSRRFQTVLSMAATAAPRARDPSAQLAAPAARTLAVGRPINSDNAAVL